MAHSSLAQHPQQHPVVTHNVSQDDGVWTLAPGPRVEGVVLLHQGEWPGDVVRRFHEVPWLDAASIRLPWRRLEPQDQRFDWGPADRLLAEVKRYNAEHPDQPPRTMHIRVLGGRFCPEWFEAAGVRMYDTAHRDAARKLVPLRTILPYDNPPFLRQLREVYRAMHDRYAAEPLVSVYHGTWSAGPWDEIFHPQWDEPAPPDYTPQRFVRGMLEQLDVLIEEFCLKGKVAELPYSGLYPPKDRIDITGPLTARIVERLGRRSPFLYIQSNGWGITNRNLETISWGHERDIDDALGQVNLALQALGTNAGGGWFPQGDWVRLIELAKRYDASYIEIYPPDLMPLDEKHRIVEAFTGDGKAGVLGYRPWLAQRARVQYVREGTMQQMFVRAGGAARVAQVIVDARTPAETRVDWRCCTRRSGEAAWSEWGGPAQLDRLPPGDEALIEVRLHTDDGQATPAVGRVQVVWE